MSGAQRYLQAGVRPARRSARKARPARARRRSAGRTSRRITLIAGAMEIFLASDVLYSQRVAPLIQQTLASNNIHGLTTSPTQLAAKHRLARTDDRRRAHDRTVELGPERATVAGHHGSALSGVSVGGTALEPEPALNHIKATRQPDVHGQRRRRRRIPRDERQVDLTVTAAGKQLKASQAIEKTEPGKTASVNIPVTGVPLRAPARSKCRRAGTRRNQPRRHQEHLPGDLRIVGSRAARAKRRPLGASRTPATVRRRPRERLTCADGRVDHRHAGNHRDRRGRRRGGCADRVRRAGADRAPDAPRPASAPRRARPAGRRRPRRRRCRTRSSRCANTSRTPGGAWTSAWRTSRRSCVARSRTARSCATTPTTSSPAISRCRSRCSTTSSRGSCCPASTTATRPASTPSRCTAARANWSSRPRRPRRCASRSHRPPARAERRQGRCLRRRARVRASAISGPRARSARRRCSQARQPTPSSRSRWRRSTTR